MKQHQRPGCGLVYSFFRLQSKPASSFNQCHTASAHFDIGPHFCLPFPSHDAGTFCSGLAGPVPGSAYQTVSGNPRNMFGCSALNSRLQRPTRLMPVPRLHIPTPILQNASHQPLAAYIRSLNIHSFLALTALSFSLAVPHTHSH